MNNIYHDKIQDDLNKRALLMKRVQDVIFKRCEQSDYGRVKPGALHQYVWHKMGFKNNVEQKFVIFITECLLNAGYVKTTYGGSQFYRGIRWKGEKNTDWDEPKAADIPRWVNRQLRFRYVINERQKIYSIDRPDSIVSIYD